MAEPVSSTPPPPGGSSGSSNRALWSLILGILGIICCGLLAPVAWYMGSQETKAIAAGMAPRESEGMAKAGMILGIIGTILLVLTVIWIVFAGGMAVIGGIMESAGT